MVEESKIQALVAEAQKGDAECFGQIYDIYAQRIFNFLLMRLRHRQASEDLVHTVFLKAWGNIKRYQQQQAKFSTWLFQIANFTLIDHWRTKRDVVEIDKIENLTSFAVEPKHFETYAYLWEAIGELPDEQRTILILRFQEDLSLTEISHVMNKSAVGTRVLQHRALKALKAILKRKQLL